MKIYTNNNDPTKVLHHQLKYKTLTYPLYFYRDINATHSFFILRDVIIKLMSVCRRRNAINVWMHYHQASHSKRTSHGQQKQFALAKSSFENITNNFFENHPMASLQPYSYNNLIKNKNKKSVDGYVREIEKKSFQNHPFYRNIPNIINYLCMKYYHESKDRFHPELHGDFIIRADNKIAKCLYSESSAFLSNIVSKESHEWRFKIVKVSNCCRDTIFFGICNNKVDFTKYLNKFCYSIWHFHFQMDLHTKSFGLNAWQGILRGAEDPRNKRRDANMYGEECTTGDIIDMCLDLNTLELRYKINDKDYGKAFDIPPGSSWRACVSLFGQDNVVRLIHYKPT